MHSALVFALGGRGFVDDLCDLDQTQFAPLHLIAPLLLQMTSYSAPSSEGIRAQKALPQRRCVHVHIFHVLDSLRLLFEVLITVRRVENASIASSNVNLGNVARQMTFLFERFVAACDVTHIFGFAAARNFAVFQKGCEHPFALGIGHRFDDERSRVLPLNALSLFLFRIRCFVSRDALPSRL